MFKEPGDQEMPGMPPAGPPAGGVEEAEDEAESAETETEGEETETEEAEEETAAAPAVPEVTAAAPNVPETTAAAPTTALATTVPAAEAAPAAPAPPPDPKLDEMKVVITRVGDGHVIGVGTPTADPIFLSVKGDLAAALAAVPGLVQDATAKWQASLQYPKAPQPAPVAATTTARSTTRAAAAPEKPKAQPSFF